MTRFANPISDSATFFRNPIGSPFPSIGPLGPVLPVTTNLLAWWDFSDRATLDVTSDGDPIGLVEDKSNDYDMSQTTTAKKPTWRKNVRNGQAISRFDRVDDYLVLTPLDAFKIDDFSVFAVCEHDITGSGSTRETLYSNRGFWSSGSIQGFRLYEESDEIRLQVGVTVSLAIILSSSGDAFPVNTWKIISAIKSGTLGTLYLDGVQVGQRNDFPANINYPISTLSTTNVGCSRQASPPVANFHGGDIAEILVFSDAKSGADQDLIEGYLAEKWGFTL